MFVIKNHKKIMQNSGNSLEKLSNEKLFKVLKTNTGKKGIEYLVQFKPNFSKFHYKWITKSEFENMSLINDYYIDQEKKKSSASSKCPYKIISAKKVKENDQTRISLMVIKKDSKDNSEPEEIPSALFKAEYPEELIKFYERHTTF